MNPTPVSKVVRHRVTVFLRDGSNRDHPVSEVALPTPDGNFFLVRDVTKGEGKPMAVDYFYPRDELRMVVISTQYYEILSDGTRGIEIPAEPKITAN